MFDSLRDPRDTTGTRPLRFWLVFSLAILLGVFGHGEAPAEERSAEQRIAEALTPLPEPLRAGATVVFDRERGKREILKNGTNHLMCRADTPAPGLTVRCHHKDLDALFTRIDELWAAGSTDDRIRQTVDGEVRSGKLKISIGATGYLLTGRSFENALPLMAIFMPGATSESTGLPTEPSQYRPWLMWAGTAAAHVMIPGK